MLVVLCACFALCSSAVTAAATISDVLADCDGASHARPLAPYARAQEPEHARALWLNERLLHWPGQAPDGTSRYRLVSSRLGTLEVRIGHAVAGAELFLPLTISAKPWPVELASRFRHLQPGRTLALPEVAPAQLRELLREQLVLIKVDKDERVLDATRLQVPGVLDAVLAPAAQRLALGASVRPGTEPGRRRSTHFGLWAPTARQVSLCLYAAEQGGARQAAPMKRDVASGGWSVELPGSLHGGAYAYLVDVWVPGQGWVRNRVTDPYATSLTPDSQRSVVVNLRARDVQPTGWAAGKRPPPAVSATDAVIYELHVRDFSVNDASVPAAHRGRYSAFEQSESLGMRHLRALAAAGMTDVHLLPVFDLASVPERDCAQPLVPAAAPDSEEQQAAVMRTRDRDCFNWGYDPWHYTAPEGSYASPGASGLRRIAEFRAMVQALHAQGLRVGMDVVYNHTTASGQDPKSVLDRIVPGYYHRLNADGQVERSSCCENTATEHRMMAKLMIDSAVVWARDHRIDAFRFDLMGHQPRAVMEDLQRAVNRAAGRTIHLIGEGWNFGEVADGARFVQASQLSLNGSGIGTFNDRLRDAVRGGGAGDQGLDQLRNQGFINGLHTLPNAAALAAQRGSRQDLLHAADLVRAGLAGSLRNYVMRTQTGEPQTLERILYGKQAAGYVSQPGEVVNYVENHDNQTLFDSLVFKLPLDTPPAERARVQTLAHALLLFSQGVPYVHAGQELLRSKSLDRNSFDSGDAFNRIDWSATDNYFGTGLPPGDDNRSSWPLMKPLLDRAADIKPQAGDLRFARDTFMDLLRIRASTSLLRLRTAQDVQRRLRFFNTGPDQLPTLVVGHVDGKGYAGGRFRELLYVVNVDTRDQAITVDPIKGRAWSLHPVHRAATAADKRAAAATTEPASGRLQVPARTAVVFVVQ